VLVVPARCCSSQRRPLGSPVVMRRLWRASGTAQAVRRSMAVCPFSHLPGGGGPSVNHTHSMRFPRATHIAEIRELRPMRY
jgi:hypothetical protein